MIRTSSSSEDPISKISRNDPCPCGSGKKYKKCHLKEDAEARSAEIAAQNAALAEAAEKAAEEDPEGAAAEEAAKDARQTPRLDRSAKGPQSAPRARQARRRGVA